MAVGVAIGQAIGDAKYTLAAFVCGTVSIVGRKSKNKKRLPSNNADSQSGAQQGERGYCREILSTAVSFWAVPINSS